MGRQGYSAEFRRRALDLLAAGRNVASVAYDLDIRDQSIYNWRRPDRIDRGETPGLSTAEKGELATANKRIGELETGLAISCRSEGVFDPVPLLIGRGRGTEADEEVGFPGAGVADEAEGPSFAIQSPVANVWMVAGLMLGFASKSKSPSYLSRGKFAAFTRRVEERRSRSSHSASSSLARKPW
jgi:transposase